MIAKNEKNAIRDYWNPPPQALPFSFFVKFGARHTHPFGGRSIITVLYVLLYHFDNGGGQSSADI